MSASTIFNAKRTVREHYDDIAVINLIDELIANQKFLFETDEEVLAEKIKAEILLHPIQEDKTRKGTASQDRGHGIIEIPLVSDKNNLTALNLRSSSGWPEPIPVLPSETEYREADHTLILKIEVENIRQKVTAARELIALINKDIDRRTPEISNQVLQIIQNVKNEFLTKRKTFEEQTKDLF